MFFPRFGREKKGAGAAFFPKTTLISILYENDQEGSGTDRERKKKSTPGISVFLSPVRKYSGSTTPIYVNVISLSYLNISVSV